MKERETFERRLGEFLPGCRECLSAETFLRRLTADECAAYEGRQAKRRATLPLTLREIEEQLAQGRGGVPDRPPAKRTQVEAATDAVLDAFRDGLILLFVDGRRCTDLEAALDVTPETRVMIVRKAMLRG